MSNIILPYEKTKRKLKEKDCQDFKPADDGTLVGDTKYCFYSFECKQIGMKTDWIYFTNPTTKSNDFDYLCTGMYATNENKSVDEEIS